MSNKITSKIITTKTIRLNIITKKTITLKIIRPKKVKKSHDYSGCRKVSLSRVRLS